MADNFSSNVEIKDEESSVFNLSNIWGIIVLNWYWLIVSTFVFLFLAVCYLKYKSPVYSSSMKVLIKDDDNKRKPTANQLMAIENMGILSNSNGFDNELEILNSANINTRVVKSLKLYVAYSRKGKVKRHELYKDNPIIVDMPQNQLNVLQAPIELELSRSGKALNVKGKIFMPNEKEELTFEKKVDKLPGNIVTPMGTIIFQQNPGFTLKDETMYATIYPLGVAGRIYSKKLAAAATSKTTTVAQVSFTDTKQARSIDYLEELVKSYNEDANEDKNEVARKTHEFINSRIELIKDELDVTENELEQYKKSNELVNLANDATTALTKTTEYQKEQVELETQLNIINALVDYMNNPANASQVIPANLGLEDAGLNTTISKYNDLVIQRNRLLKSSSEDNPYVQRISTAIEEMWPTIRVSLEAIRNDINTKKRSADSQFNMFNTKINSTPTQERVLTNFSRQQEIKANLYLTLLQKREENYISLASTATKARIIDSPQILGKVSPKTSIILIAALLFGLCFPIGLEILKSLLRFHIEGREDIEKLTKLPIIADIPLGKETKDGENAVVVKENTNDTMEEAFRGLRTSLGFILDSGEKVIGCTSCIPGEGKTFISTNLAMSLALLGKKTIIIGLDIRKPRLVKLFGLPKSTKGITTFLAADHGDAELLDEQITHGVLNTNLDVLPAGIIPPNPGELVSRDQLPHAIKLLKEKYDYIVIDTPPVGLVSDTLSIGRVTEMTLLTCRADYSLRSNFSLINALAEENKLPKINLVLNGVDLKKKKYGYYYGYGKYGKNGKYGKYGKYGHYGHYGVYGNYGKVDSSDNKE